MKRERIKVPRTIRSGRSRSRTFGEVKEWRVTTQVTGKILTPKTYTNVNNNNNNNNNKKTKKKTKKKEIKDDDDDDTVMTKITQ